MKDTKTVLPTVNGGENTENKNGFIIKNKTQEFPNDDQQTTTITGNGTNNEELVGGCCVCSDDQGFPNNALVYCDGKGCTVACHTACYGIVSIPEGDWYCGRCEARDIQAICRLCPITDGAMKRTSDGGWAHVVCALYIPEASFGDDSTMEPIILSKIPSSRYGQECSICLENGRSKLIATSGACCGCTIKNCSQVFHVTCAQANGLLCEDVRKNNCQYLIYCEQHRPKLSKLIRQISAYTYSQNTFATEEQIKRQHSNLKDKESPSQLSDFVAAAAAEAAAKDTNSTSTLNDSNNQTISNDEQQTPVSRSSHSIDILPRKSTSNTNSSLSSSTSLSPIVQQKTHSRSSSTSSSSNLSLQKKAKLNDETNNNRSLNDLSQFVQLNKEERNSVQPSTTNSSHEKEKTIKSDSLNKEKKETTNDNSKSSNVNLDQPSSMNSIEEKPLASRCSISSSHDNNKSPIKQRHSTDISSLNIKSISIRKLSTTKTKDEKEDDEDYEIHKKRKISNKLNKDEQIQKKRQHSAEGGPRPVGRPPSKKTLLAQQFTNGIKPPFLKATTSTINSNPNNMKPQKINDTFVNLQQHSSGIENDNEIKLKSRSTHFYQCDHFGNQINSDVFKQHGHSDEKSQQILSIDTNDESIRQRIPSSTSTRIDFYPRRPLQNSSTLSTTTEQRTFPPQTLEEFLEQEWELSSDFLLQQTMPHDVSSLLSCLYQFKSENASLQKRFDELKHRRDTLRVTNANLRRRLSEILPINETIPPCSTTTTVTQVSPPTVQTVVPPSPRKEQQQLKQQKLLAELELQQQLQRQKTISPSRRPSSTHNDSNQQTIKKSKSPRQSNPLSNQSLLENQLRQSTNKLISTTIPNTKKLTSSEIETVSHHQSTTSFEQIDVAATAAYPLGKNARPTTNTSVNIELLSQILAASGNSISPQLFAPTWNISNFGYANFPGANQMSVSEETILRSLASTTHPSLDQQQQSSTKQQP